MASIFNQDIGLNYKGIITLGSTINQNLSGTLQYLTDGDGNNLPLQLATGLVAVDGGTIAFTTGTNTRNVLTQTYTINNTGGTNTITGIKVNAIETAVVGTTHSLLDLQVGGQSRLRYTPTANGGLQITRTDNAYVSVSLNNSGVIIHQNLSLSCSYFTPANGTILYTGSSWTIGSNAVNSARLHVRGDGTNPIFRAENSAGTEFFTLSNSGVFNFSATSGAMTITPGTTITVSLPTFFASVGGMSFNFSTPALSGAGTINKLISSQTYTLTGASATNVNEFKWTTIYNLSANTGVINIIDLNHTINQTSGANGITRGLYVNPTLTAAADFRAYDSNITFANASGSNKLSLFNANYTINNTGTTSGSIVTGIKLNATETSITGTTHNLIDLQVGGVSRFNLLSSGFFRLGPSATNSINFDANGFLYYSGANRFYVSNTGIIYGYNELRNTGNVFIGSIAVTPTARLHVRGDGTNPIARFETSAGGASYIINSTGTAHTFTGSVDVSDVVNVAATRGYFWTNRGGIATSGDGIILLRNNNNTDFNRLNFGGNTSSFPSLKRNTIALEARLADDSDFTFIQGKLRTETNFTSEPAVMASGYIVLYDLDGTAYKVLATAL